MQIRAKFRVSAVTPHAEGSVVSLEAVTGGSVENESFFKWTPSGQIQLGLLQPETAAAFRVGGYKYVDFSDAASE